MPTFDLDGQSVAYAIRRSNRARHVRLTFSPSEGLVIVLPRRCPLRHVPTVLEEKSRWIRKQLSHSLDAPARGPEGTLRDGQQVWFRGEAHSIRLVPLAEGTRGSTLAIDEGMIRVHLHPRDQERAREILERWMRQQARERIEDRLRAIAVANGFIYGSVFIRDQRTRWGSCSRQGNLSFSWRLVMAPPEVLEYVVAHELAHLRELNHSSRFWRLLESLVGDPKPARAWLRQHGGSLRLADAD